MAEAKYDDAPKGTYDEKARANQARIEVVPTVVAAHLAQGGKLGVSVAQFLRWALELEHHTPDEADLTGACRMVADLARLRTLQSLCHEVAARIRVESVDPTAMLETTAAQVAALCARADEEPHEGTAAKLAAESIEALRRAVDDRRRGIVRTTSTGFRAFDDATAGGMRGSELWVVAARPGGGKSALALNLAANVAARGGGVLFFSLEMGKRQLLARMASSESGVPLRRIREATVTDAEWPALTRAYAFLESLPLGFDWASAKPLQRLTSQARRAARAWKAKHKGAPLRLVVVDYVGLVTTPHLAKSAERHLQIAEISRALKALARELDVCVLALAQMTREGEKAERRAPRMSDLAESAQLERDADLIAFLTSQEVTPQREVRVTLAKQRDDGAGGFALFYDGPLVRFTDVERRPAARAEYYPESEADE